MRRILLTAILIFGLFGLFGMLPANAQNKLKGNYIYQFKNDKDSFDFYLKFEREDSVYYSYAYEGFGTIGGKWALENGLIKVVLTRGDANWTFELKPKGSDLELTETLSKTGTDETPDFTKILPVGTVFKKDISKPTGPDLTAEDASRRILKLIASVHTLKDISPENIERQMKIKPVFNEKDSNEYGFGGNIKDAPDWFYGVFAYPYPSKDNTTTDTLRFSFDYQLHEPITPNLSPVCTVNFDAFSKELKAVGFSSTPIYGSHNRLNGWNFFRDKTHVNISVNGGWKPSDSQCVKLLTISIMR